MIPIPNPPHLLFYPLQPVPRIANLLLIALLLRMILCELLPHQPQLTPLTLHRHQLTQFYMFRVLWREDPPITPLTPPLPVTTGVDVGEEFWVGDGIVAAVAVVGAANDEALEEGTKEGDWDGFEMAFALWAAFGVFVLLVLVDGAAQPFADAVWTEARVAAFGATGYGVPDHVEADWAWIEQQMYMLNDPTRLWSTQRCLLWLWVGHKSRDCPNRMKSSWTLSFCSEYYC